MAKCNIEGHGYFVVGEDLIIESFDQLSNKAYYKIALPFSLNAKKGDFLFFQAIDGVLPSPFTSINDFLPKNGLEDFTDFTVYPYFWSALHHAVAFLDEKKITEAFEKEFRFFNDANDYNLFSLAIERGNA